MAAPPKNQFWKLRSKHGRNKLFESPEALWQAACEYFQWCEDNPMYRQELVRVGPNRGELLTVPYVRPFTIQGMARYCGVSANYFRSQKKTGSEEMKEMVAIIIDTIYQQKLEGAAVGFFKPAIIARELSLSDQAEKGVLPPWQITVQSEEEKQILENLGKPIPPPAHYLHDEKDDYTSFEERHGLPNLGDSG